MLEAEGVGEESDAEWDVAEDGDEGSSDDGDAEDVDDAVGHVEVVAAVRDEGLPECTDWLLF